MRKIDLLVPDMPNWEELRPWIERIDQARWYTNNGQLVNELVVAVGSYLGSSTQPVHAALCSSGTLALMLAIKSFFPHGGACVLVPSFSFAACTQAVINTGNRPVYCDVDANNMMLTPAIAEAALVEFKLDLVMPVCAYGTSVDIAGWQKFRHDHGIPVLIDAAAAFGNIAISDIPTTFSLHATKQFSSCEGGAVCSTDEKFIADTRLATNFGIDIKTGDVLGEGFNAKMSEYHAAVGLANLERWPSSVKRIHELRDYYLSALAKFSHLSELRYYPGANTPVPPVFAIRLADGDKRMAKIMVYLRSKGIGLRQWYLPLAHEMTRFAAYPCTQDLTNSYLLTQQILCLPFHRLLSFADIDFVVEQLAIVLADKHLQIS